jgi:polysaccharide export outer membrane protein
MAGERLTIWRSGERRNRIVVGAARVVIGESHAMSKVRCRHLYVVVLFALALAIGRPTHGQPPAGGREADAATESDFVIGPEDVLGILVWREQEVTSEVTVRADGMITLPLIRDVKAAGLTPNELAEQIQTSLREFITDASVTVVVKQMRSRKVFITGEIAKPGVYLLPSSVTVLQLLAIAGGLTEFADANGISVLRLEDGTTTTLLFAYKDVAKGRRPEQNIVLKPGDTVVVPEK